MIVYHVTSLKKLNKYLKSGQIEPPVRAWDNIEQAERMSLSTGRRIILRLKFPDNADFNQDRILNNSYKLSKDNY